MKLSSLFIKILSLISLFVFSQTATALSLIGEVVPVELEKSYDLRDRDPLKCIDMVNTYEKNLHKPINTRESNNKNTNSIYAFPTQLQAFCYTQIEDYTHALNLLQPLLKTPSTTYSEIATLSLIALNIPESERPQLSNQILLAMLDNTVKKTLSISPRSALTIQLTSAHLYLQENNYRKAYLALEIAQKLIQIPKYRQLGAWLEYYYGLYYEQINQPQLAITYLLSANKLAEKNTLIKLSALAKETLANIYQHSNHFLIALKFSDQQIELYQSTKNRAKQISSLIEHAILQRKNTEYNQSIITLLNALELIQNNENPALLAHIYLQLGETYLNLKSKKNLELAQKYLQNARLNFIHLNNSRYQSESLLLLAKLNMINNDPGLAILQLEKLLSISKEKYNSLRVQAYEMLAKSYEKIGYLEQAITYFNSFHELQNAIKADLVELQQLQINEQLLLLEKSQRHKQLENQNNQLKKSTYLFRILTYSFFSILILMTLICIYMFNRNKKLNHLNNDAHLRLSFHPRTKLPYHKADDRSFDYVYQERPLYYALLNIPFLSEVNELLGINIALKIEEKLGKKLKSNFVQDTEILQVRDNQILLIVNQKEYTSAETLGLEIEHFFNVFCEEQKLDHTISCGIVAFPFLKNANRAFSSSEAVSLSSIALSAADQIRKQKQQTSWVELYAIDNLQPAFLTGDLWPLTQTAINKGILKTNSSHSDFKINWLLCDK